MIDVNNSRKKANPTSVYLKSNTRWWAAPKRTGVASIPGAQPIIFNDGDLDLAAWTTWALTNDVITVTDATIDDATFTGVQTQSNYKTVTAAAYDVSPTADYIIYADGGSNAVTITLPSAVLYPGAEFKIFAVDTTTNVVTVDADAGNVNGGPSIAYAADFENYTFHSDGTDWWAW